MTSNWQNELDKASKPEKIKILSSFFKTGKGEYGEGDIFIGVTVPDNRKIAIKHSDCTFADISVMLQHPIHEYRLSALLAIVRRFQKTKDETAKRDIVRGTERSV